jgi:hypothetical protein
MSEPAKDEAELLERLAKGSLCDGRASCSGEKSCLGCFAKADAVLAAIRAAGWAVVPVEPTEEIQDAIIDATFNMDYIADDEAAKIYQAAIKAAAPGVKS